MSRKSFIDSVEVKTPCSESWAGMKGSSKVRFCSHCSTTVSNLSELTRKEAKRVVRAADGNICIRYIVDPVTKRPMFADHLLQITRRAPSLAAGVMSLSFGLSTAAYAQSTSVDTSVAVNDARPSDKIELVIDGKKSPENDASQTPSLRLSGTIKDTQGALIPDAAVKLFSLQAGGELYTTTDGEGVYHFKNLVPGTYRIESNAPGFGETATQITLGAERPDEQVDSTLDVAQIELTVDIIATEDVQMSTTISGGGMAVEYSTPLASAVDDEDVDAVRSLLARGADPNGKDDNYDKITPLFIAVENGNIEITRMLLDFGAKVNARDGSKETPLMRIDDDATNELVLLLLNAGARVDVKDENGSTPLIHAVTSRALPDIILALIDMGSDVNAADNDGETALMAAADRDDADAVRALLSRGANVNLKDNDDDGAIDRTSDEEVRELLLEAGAVVKPEVETPLIPE